MSRGFRDADTTQAMSDKAVADQIQRILHGGNEPPAETADGRCLDCGEPIGEERLAALPGTVRCVGCQAARERSPRS